MDEVAGPEVFLRVAGLRIAYAAKTALDGVELTIPAGEFVGIIGPNGAGKSSLLRCLARTLQPRAGAIYLAGRDLVTLPQRQVAREVAVAGLDEEGVLTTGRGFSVREIVAMGRYPHRQRGRRFSREDEEAVRQAIHLTGLASLQGQKFGNLSSGERQRVIIARALAQGTKLLLLDEPTAHLDLTAQVEMFNLLRALNLQQGLTIIAVLHDLNLAAQFCDRLVLLDRGRIAAVGEPAEVLRPEVLAQVYRLEVAVVPDLTTGRPRIFWRAASPAGEKRDERRPPVHVIGGGGTAAPILEALARAGYRLSSGVLNRYDSDWHYAGGLGVEMVVEEPFAPITPAREEAHRAMLERAAVVVVAPIPIGPGNLANLRLALETAERGKPVILAEFTPVTERDFTGGEGTRLWELLAAKAAVAHSLAEVLSCLRDQVPGGQESGVSEKE